MDLEKSFDIINRNQLRQIINKSGKPYYLIEVIKSLYKNSAVQIVTERKFFAKIYTNQAVRQGCNLTAAIFNIYIDDLLRNWKQVADAGIKHKRNL